MYNLTTNKIRLFYLMRKIVKKIILLLSVFFLSIPLVSHAAGKVATCQIDEQGKTTFKGKCKFQSDGGGSFTLMNVNENKPLAYLM